MFEIASSKIRVWMAKEWILYIYVAAKMYYTYLNQNDYYLLENLVGRKTQV